MTTTENSTNPSASKQRVIKKYPNRRLYDTDTSSYITLAEVRQLVIEREPLQLLAAKPFLLRHRSAFLAQIRQPHPSLQAAFDAIATLEYTPNFDHCVAVAGGFLDSL